MDILVGAGPLIGLEVLGSGADCGIKGWEALHGGYWVPLVGGIKRWHCGERELRLLFYRSCLLLLKIHPRPLQHCLSARCRCVGAASMSLLAWFLSDCLPFGPERVTLEAFCGDHWFSRGEGLQWPLGSPHLRNSEMISSAVAAGEMEGGGDLGWVLKWRLRRGLTAGALPWQTYLRLDISWDGDTFFAVDEHGDTFN